jgi:LDH2 family malate/lactate/ureidoglycolate dehydrogenase
MVLVAAQDLEVQAVAILRKAGASDENARLVARHLVEANLSGVDTHGIFHLPLYLEEIKHGWLIPDARPATLSEGPNSARISGNWTFGQVAAEYATKVLARLASASGIAAVAVVQCNHIGRLGRYSELLAAEDLLGMVFAGGFAEENPVAAPFGGRSALLSTNPLSMGLPAGAEPRVMFDFATTALAGSKIMIAKERGQRLPDGALIDRDGRPTTDPGDFFRGGSLVPFGGHKGYAISMAVEFLGRILTGSDNYSDPQRGGPTMRHQGVLLLAIRADLFSNLEEYRARADDLIRRTHAVEPVAGGSRVLVPGDPELHNRRTRAEVGIEVDDQLWATLTRLAEQRDGAA